MSDILHGTLTGYTTRGCRCEACTRAQRVHMRNYRSRRKTQPIPDDKHGTTTGYTIYGCRCKACKAAKLESQQRYRAKLVASLKNQQYLTAVEADDDADPLRPVHGLYSTYLNWNCRCEPCRQAHIAYRARRYHIYEGTEPPQHGTVTGYRRYRCRCAACVTASSENQRAYRARRKQRDPSWKHG